jgi:DNA-binding GntR family transcriptional regulator
VAYAVDKEQDDAASDSLGPVNDHSLATIIAEKLRRAITQGEFAPGEKLREPHLAELFKTSRTPVREALQALHQEGIIDIVPRRGARVPALEAVDVANIYLCRATLFGLAARIAATRRTDEEAEDLQARVAAMGVVANDHQWLRYVEAMESVGERLIALSRVPQIGQMLRPLSGPTLALRFKVASESSRTSEVLAKHTGIADAVRARDSETAEAITSDLYLASGRWLVTSQFEATDADDALESLKYGQTRLVLATESGD